MQRKLTIALVALTLFAVILVGAGVLAFAQVGGRNDTEVAVGSRLESIAALTADIPSLDRLGPAVNRLGRTFGEGDIQVVLISQTGSISGPAKFQGGVVRDNDVGSFDLSETDHTRYLAGETIFVGGGRTVTGIRLLDIDAPRAAERGITVAIVGRQSTTRLPAEARRWFVISAVVVLLTSVLAASLLSRRLVAPLRDIESATNRLAQGDLSTRIDVRGSDEMAELGHSVNQMATDLERSRQLEQQFLLSVSHDLRTPLTSIRGYAEALTDGAITDGAEAGRIIQNHADRLGRLVTDLLDLAKLNARQFRIEPQAIDAADFVAQTVDGLVPTATGHELDLSTSGTAGLCISVDPDRLAQVISNVVENAIKYATTQIHVGVEAVRLPDGTPGVAITIADDGPGIADQDLPHIFERLYVTQLRPIREESSSGLGLAIVQELTTAMGGTVKAERAPSGGTAIVLAFAVVAQRPVRQ